ncbi:TlpA family protein disulfide reductase [Mucilaginibacter phyllosphaerae]|nr:TlpA disulfide reductase family protein [Mucilaginibacter phyllosphaerae]GGH23426.1 hypothetical protein GCM10007352_37310 [Mucilaginibacter phyllosphaerae]
MPYYKSQARFENVKSDAGSQRNYKDFVQRYDVDTTYLISQKIVSNYIYLLTGIDSAGKKHVIIDTNNDHDLNNEQEYVFDPKTFKQTLPVIQSWVSYYDGRIIRWGKVLLQIDPYNLTYDDDHYKSAVEKQLDISLNVLTYNKAGYFTIGRQLYKISLINYDGMHPKTPYNINIQKLPFDKKNNNEYYYKSIDTIGVAADLYQVKDMTGNKLALVYIGKSNGSGAETGTMAPDIVSKDIRSNSDFKLGDEKGKYILLDFWGSWCRPCIKLIPELRKLNKTYQDKIKFVSIAYDKVKDKGKLLKLIEDNEMHWLQLLDNREVKNGIIDQFKVNEFPTSILIDPKGKVVYRGIGEKGLTGAIDFFKNKK